MALYRQKTRPSAKPQAAISASPVSPDGPTATGTSSAPVPEADDSKLHIRGPRNPVIKLEIWGDFQCPSCAVASRVIDELQREFYADKMQVIFHEFPLAMHRHAKEAAMAAEAAGFQGKFWEMHDALYKYQDVWSKVGNARFFFESYAQEIGLDMEQYKADRDSVRVDNIVLVDGLDGQARGVRNTPTIFIDGVEQKTAFNKEKLKEAIDAALAAKKS